MTSDDEATRGGLLTRASAFLRSHPRGTALTGGALAVVLLGGGSLAAGATTAPATEVAAPTSTSPAPASSPSPTVTKSPSAKPTAAATAAPVARTVPSPAAAPVPLRTCSVASAASDSRLGSFEGTVLNASTGATLFDRDGQTPARTGSVMKTLTTAVALSVLGPNYQFSTKVVGGGDSIALVGGGDATLSALPSGQESVYPGAPKITDLATQVKAKVGDAEIKTVVLDDSYWNDADRYDSSWPLTERTIGYQPEVVALMVDGDRANPALATSPRSTDPVGKAGAAFRTALTAAGVKGADKAKFVRGTARSTTVLGEVKSQPVSTLVGQMIPNSDNTLAEMLARVSSKVSGSDGSAASLTSVYQAALKKSYGLDASALKIVDGSGESANNGVPSAFEANLMIKVLNRQGSLGILYDALPVSGRSGTLASRFVGANAIAAGAVHAKTGWIDSAYTLAGTIDAKDGTKLTFAFYAIGNVSGSAREALDTLTTAVYSCGANLTTT
jgi:D-alanyl-D-alanine carboxypeptidase/D-alanyl-D-alanine-endopeptidase (penicillin-binding protein 4)